MQCNCITISSLIAFYVSARSSSLESIAMHCCTITTLTTQYLHLEGKTQNTTHIYLEDKKVTFRKHTLYLIGICTKSEVLVMNAKTPEHNISIWKETYQLWMQKVMLLQFEYIQYIYRSIILSKIQHLHLANEIFQKNIGKRTKLILSKAKKRCKS